MIMNCFPTLRVGCVPRECVLVCVCVCVCGREWGVGGGGGGEGGGGVGGGGWGWEGYQSLNDGDVILIELAGVVGIRRHQLGFAQFHRVLSGSKHTLVILL